MEDALVARWNEWVKPGDEVWHLGDFAFRMNVNAVASLLGRLHGRKHLVIGNNDGPSTFQQPEWASTQNYAELELEGARLVLCHYPFRTWNGMYRGAYNIHGHSHGQLAKMRRQIDVGVDVWEFRPILLDDIRASRRKPRVRQRIA